MLKQGLDQLARPLNTTGTVSFAQYAMGGQGRGAEIDVHNSTVSGAPAVVADGPPLAVIADFQPPFRAAPH